VEMKEMFKHYKKTKKKKIQNCTKNLLQFVLF
jgi:hypothetical protein